MKKLFVALQTPSVEVPITTEKDVTGKTAKCIAVFRRHDTNTADAVKRKFDEIVSKVFVTLDQVQAVKDRTRLIFSYAPEEVIESEVAKAESEFLSGKTLISNGEVEAKVRQQTRELRDFLHSQIIALKKVPLEIGEFEDGECVGTKAFLLEDTRTAGDNPELWGDAKNCLSEILEHLLSSNPWSTALVKTQQKVFYNLTLASEAESKN